MTNWRKTVNIKDLIDTDESPEAAERVAHAIAARLHKAFQDTNDDLTIILENLNDIKATDKHPISHLNWLLDELYDWADAERIWLGL